MRSALARSASRQSVADRGRILIRRRTDADCPAQLRPVSISILMKRRRATPGEHVRMVRPSLSGQSARGTFRFAKAAAFNQTVVLINRAERFTSFSPRFLARTTTNPLDRWDGLKNIPISMRREVAVRVQPIPLCVPGGMGTAGSYKGGRRTGRHHRHCRCPEFFLHRRHGVPLRAVDLSPPPARDDKRNGLRKNKKPAPRRGPKRGRRTGRPLPYPGFPERSGVFPAAAAKASALLVGPCSTSRRLTTQPNESTPEPEPTSRWYRAVNNGRMPERVKTASVRESRMIWGPGRSCPG